LTEETNEELWKPIPGFEGAYEISNHGNVRSWKKWRGSTLPLPRLMKVQTSTNGRRSVQLGLHGGTHSIEMLLHEVWEKPLPEYFHANREDRQIPLVWRRDEMQEDPE